jgi:hypothetical protein
LAEILKVHINKMYEVCKAANVVSILTWYSSLTSTLSRFSRSTLFVSHFVSPVYLIEITPSWVDRFQYHTTPQNLLSRKIIKHINNIKHIIYCKLELSFLRTTCKNLIFYTIIVY